MILKRVFRDLPKDLTICLKIEKCLLCGTGDDLQAGCFQHLVRALLGCEVQHIEELENPKSLIVSLKDADRITRAFTDRGPIKGLQNALNENMMQNSLNDMPEKMKDQFDDELIEEQNIPNDFIFNYVDFLRIFNSFYKEPMERNIPLISNGIKAMYSSGNDLDICKYIVQRYHSLILTVFGTNSSRLDELQKHNYEKLCTLPLDNAEIADGIKYVSQITNLTTTYEHYKRNREMFRKNDINADIFKLAKSEINIFGKSVEAELWEELFL